MTGHTDQLPVSLPAGLDELPPGGDLAQALAGVRADEVSGHDAVSLAEVAYHQATYSRAVFLRAVAESGMRAPGSVDSVEHVEHPSEFSADEVRAALVWSRTRAESTFWLAHSVFVRLPMLGEAMLTGRLDEPRAKAFVDWTTGLSDAHAERVCDELLGVAPSLLVGQLSDRIKRLAIALDPDWAQRRYDDAVKARRVESWQSPDGTANVAGRDLPADRAQAGTDRINTLARAAKSAGDGRAMDAIRADLFLGMLDGQFVGLTDQQIVQHLLAHPIADGEPGGTAAPDAEPDDAPDSAAESDDAARRGDEPDEAAEDGFGAGSEEPDVAARETRHEECDETAGAETDDAGAEHSPPDAHPEPKPGAWNVSELRVELGTLMRLDGHPAELPGLGYIPAGAAHEMLPRLLGAQWRFVMCDSDGVPIYSGVTSARPRLNATRGATAEPRGRGIVELQLTREQLRRWRREIDAGQHAAWSDVILDICELIGAGTLDGFDNDRGHGGADEDAQTGGDVSTDDPAGDVRDHEGDVRRRVARVGLRRWVEARDRYCLHPACRMPAIRTDQDHRIDYAAGGLTIEENLDSVCRHDHRLIHEGGWTTRRGSSGEIIWRSALGHTYVARPPPVMAIYPDPEPGIADAA